MSVRRPALTLSSSHLYAVKCNDAIKIYPRRSGFDLRRRYVRMLKNLLLNFRLSPFDPHINIRGADRIDIKATLNFNKDCSLNLPTLNSAHLKFTCGVGANFKRASFAIKF